MNHFFENVCETGTLACEKSVTFEDIVPLIENLMKENYVT